MSNNTNLITTENINHLKMVILADTTFSFNAEQLLLNVHQSTSMFDYETEELETEVFSFVLNEMYERLEEKKQSIVI